MARPRNPNRDKAKEIWVNNKDIKLKDLANQLGETSNTIRKWKSQDKWEEDNPSEGKTTKKKPPRKKSGAPKGNQNALNNKGGAPKGNNNATSHGFFKKIFPDDDETFSILDEIQTKSPADIVWEQVVIQYAAIARSQKIMFVANKDDMTKEENFYMHSSSSRLTNSTESTQESEQHGYLIQFAWDKQANFLKAQSRAMAELRNLIKDFMHISGKDDKRRLELEKMQQHLAVEKDKLEIAKQKLELDKIRIIGEEDEYEDDGFIAALDGKTAGVWDDDEDSSED